jgi:hypothetical protein
MPSPSGDATRRWGLFINGNGIYYELEGDGLDWELYAVRKNNGVVTRQPLRALIIEKLPNFDPSKNNTYDVQFQWRSAGDYMWFVNQVLVYQEKNLGTLTGLSMRMPASPVNFEAITNDGVEYEMSFGCVDVSSEGGKVPLRQAFSIDTGGIQSMLTVNNSANGTAVLGLKIPRSVSYGGGTVENTQAVILDKLSSWTRDEADVTILIGRDINITNLDGLTWGQTPDSLTQFLVGGNGSALDVAYQTDVGSMTTVVSEAEEIEVKNIITNPDQEEAPYYATPGDIVVVAVRPLGNNKENTSTLYVSEEI